MKLIQIITILTLTLFLTSCGGIEKLKISDTSEIGGKKMDTATFETNYGTFKIKLFVDEMPITTGNFIKLAKEGFYDGTKSHRIIARFMIQGGDPLTKDDSKKQLWGTGDPGYKIKDEFGEVGNNKGTIAMANSGPNTGGSQFFINLVNNNYLDSKHPVFGEVVEGMEIVEKIGAVQTGARDVPVEDVVIEKVVIS
jgi:peptidylprolyl isomerase